MVIVQDRGEKMAPCEMCETAAAAVKPNANLHNKQVFSVRRWYPKPRIHGSFLFEKIGATASRIFLSRYRDFCRGARRTLPKCNVDNG